MLIAINRGLFSKGMKTIFIYINSQNIRLRINKVSDIFNNNILLKKRIQVYDAVFEKLLDNL